MVLPEGHEAPLKDVRHRGLQVSGCSHATVADIFEGSFVPFGENHGRPVYKKNTDAKGEEVVIYFWDARDGAIFSGWYFSCGDQIWAHNDDASAATPPRSGWKVHGNGPVDQGVGAGATKASGGEAVGSRHAVSRWAQAFFAATAIAALGIFFSQVYVEGQFTPASMSELWSTSASSWMIWPVANLTMFWLVPADMQVPLGSVVNFALGVYLKVAGGQTSEV